MNDSQKKLKIAINGFGRIGRNVLRAWCEQGCPESLEIIAINDIADADVLVHLLRYDTTHGRFKGKVSLDVDLENKYLLITPDVIFNEKTQQLMSNTTQISSEPKQFKIQLLQESAPKNLPWNALHVDVALECTGFFRSREGASQHLTAGAGRVIIGAAPFDTVDVAVVYGINEAEIKPTDRLISSVSCTTQALVPLVKLLDDEYGIESAMMTEIHAMTTDQAVLDQAHRDFRRARSASHNIIPTTSSALGALKRILPHMESRIAGYSIRVPTTNVAAIDLSFTARETLSVESINTMLIQAGQGKYRHIMDTTHDELVSSDFNHQPFSLVVDLPQTMVVNQLAKVFVWYDNEWGYANRLLDLCQVLIEIPLVHHD